MEKQVRKEYKERIKKHREMQSDQTLDMMKNTQGKSRKTNQIRRVPFFRKWKSCNNDDK